MENERFLIVSYVVSGLFCACLATGAYLWLRRPANAVFNALRRPDLERALGRAFPVSTILLVLAAFLGVGYYSSGCNQLNYSQIVSNREHVISVLHEQAAESLSSVAVAVVVWSGVILLCLVVVRRDHLKRPSPQDDQRG